jgi:modulator of FtsH protease
MALGKVIFGGKSMQPEMLRTSGAGVTAPARNNVLRNTYLMLALTMIPTVIGAAIGVRTASVVMASPILWSLVVLGAMIGLQFAIAANRNSFVGVALLLLLTGILGWWLGPMLNYALSLSNGMQLVGYAAVSTGVIFFVMGMIAATSKRDFSFMGKFLFVGMIALLIAGIANMFLQIPALALALSTLVVVIFSLFLLYDMQRIIRGGETNYIIATTQVYISLWAIFSHLLNILLALAGNRE